jgi:hypothetical protein
LAQTDDDSERTASIWTSPTSRPQVSLLALL